MIKEKTAQINEQLETDYAERDTFINFLINLQERIENNRNNEYNCKWIKKN